MESFNRFNSNKYYNKQIVERIKMVMKDKDINNKRFASEFNISESGVSGILKGTRQISIDKVVDFCYKYGVSTEVILFGVGPMYKDLSEEINIIENIDDKLMAIIAEVNKYNARKRNAYYKHILIRLLSEL